MADKGNGNIPVETTNIDDTTNQWKEERWHNEIVNDSVCIIVDNITNENDNNYINSDKETNNTVELIPINNNMHNEVTGEEKHRDESTFNEQGRNEVIVEDDDSKENYDMDEIEEEQYNRNSINEKANEHCNNDEDGDGDDFDECDETKKLVIVTENNTENNFDLEDCDYYSDGDSANDEREEILKYSIGDGIIANLFVGLYK